MCRPDGITFKAALRNDIGTFTELRRGDLVTFSYENISTTSLPVNPKITRVRLDRTWFNVLQEHHDGHLVALAGTHLQEHSKLGTIAASLPKERARIELEKFAKSINLDPLAPNTWYSSYAEFMQRKVFDVSRNTAF